MYIWRCLCIFDIGTAWRTWWTIPWVLSSWKRWPNYSWNRRESQRNFFRLMSLYLFKRLTRCFGFWLIRKTGMVHRIETIERKPHWPSNPRFLPETLQSQFQPVVQDSCTVTNENVLDNHQKYKSNDQTYSSLISKGTGHCPVTQKMYWTFIRSTYQISIVQHKY